MQAREKSLTPIMQIASRYTAYFLIKKNGQKVVPFESAKNEIFAKAMKGREGQALREYFEKQKAEASIKVIRRVQ